MGGCCCMWPRSGDSFLSPLPRNGSYLSFSYSKHIFRFSIDGYVSVFCLLVHFASASKPSDYLVNAMTVRPRTSYFGNSVCRKSLDETRRTYWPHCLTVRSKSLRNLFEQFLSLSLHPRFFPPQRRTFNRGYVVTRRLQEEIFKKEFGMFGLWRELYSSLF